MWLHRISVSDRFGSEMANKWKGLESRHKLGLERRDWDKTTMYRQPAKGTFPCL